MMFGKQKANENIETGYRATSVQVQLQFPVFMAFAFSPDVEQRKQINFEL